MRIPFFPLHDFFDLPGWMQPRKFLTATKRAPDPEVMTRQVRRQNERRAAKAHRITPAEAHRRTADERKWRLS